MRIIPVIDVLNEKVVHGKKGERDKYEEIKSVICSDSNPLTVSKAFKTKFNFNELYIADLDAIMKGRRTYNYIKTIFEATNMRIITDAGVTTIKEAEILFKNGAEVVIIATETLDNFQELAEIVDKFGAEKIITSIDLFNGNVMAKNTEIKNLTPVEIAIRIQELGINESIVLELTRVGSNQGVALDQIKKIQQNTTLEILTGGGVRSVQDLINLKNLNLSGILIATAFHNGSITPEDINKI